MESGLFLTLEIDNIFNLGNINTKLSEGNYNFTDLFGSHSKDEFKNNFSLLLLKENLSLGNYLLTDNQIDPISDFNNNIVLSTLNDLTSNLSINGINSNFDNHLTILPWINQIDLNATYPCVDFIIRKGNIYSDGFNQHILYFPIQEELFNYNNSIVKINLNLVDNPNIDENYVFYMKKENDSYLISDNPNNNYKSIGFSIVLSEQNTESTIRLNHIFNGSGGIQITDEGSLIGDPHITTLFGYKYHFNYLGYFRILETENIIINGLSIRGTQRWKKKQYIRKILIKYNNKILIADLGFRGERCYIERNDGFKTINKELDFHPDRKIHCFNRYCLKEFSTIKQAKQHLKETRNRHKVLMPVRNQIEIDVDKILKVTISNINEYNFQPCRIRVKPLVKLVNAKGPIINSIYANDCVKLDSLDDYREIKYENLKIQEFDKIKCKKNLV